MFYSVIETRDFSLFNQSAQALLKGYFIIDYISVFVQYVTIRQNKSHNYTVSNTP